MHKIITQVIIKFASVYTWIVYLYTCGPKPQFILASFKNMNSFPHVHNPQHYLSQAASMPIEIHGICHTIYNFMLQACTLQLLNVV
jgi:hypothetical protein